MERKTLIWSSFPEKQGVVFPENMAIVNSHVLICTDGIQELEERVGLERQRVFQRVNATTRFLKKWNRVCSYEFPLCSTARLVAIDILISKTISFKWTISEKVRKEEAGMPCMEELEIQIHCDSLTFVS